MNTTLDHDTIRRIRHMTVCRKSPRNIARTIGYDLISKNEVLRMQRQMYLQGEINWNPDAGDVLIVIAPRRQVKTKP